MAVTITDVTVCDMRYPTSRARDGSDAVDPGAPGFSITMKLESRDRYAFGGSA